MKKTLFFLTMLPLLLFSNIATGQAERTFVKSFNLLGRQTASLNLGSNVQVIQWDNDILRVQMTVNLPTTNDATLKALAESGRYALKNDMDLHTLSISAPNLLSTIKLNSNELKENVSFIVYVPKSITVLKNTDPNAKIVAKLNP
jgi:hypothetical protein